MTTKIVQKVTPCADSKMVGVKKLVVDKDSEDYLEYQVELNNTQRTKPNTEMTSTNVFV